jgi:hypothetical protein
MASMDRGEDTRLLEAAHELLKRTERTLLAIYGGGVRATAKDTAMLIGFRLALVWVLSFGGTEPK